MPAKDVAVLDFSQIFPQITAFTTGRVDAMDSLNAALNEAARRLRDSDRDWETTREKIARSRTSWLLAKWREAPDARVPAPHCPEIYTALAADGSQIVADRHDIALCYVLNVGLITLRYGTSERAVLTSRPILCDADEDLMEAQEGDTAIIAPRRLGLRRQMLEIAELAGRATQIATEKSPAPPALALFDGSLILWTLEGETDNFRRETLANFAEGMAEARLNRVPIAGYVSVPQSRDVVNALRIFACPHENAQCDTHCKDRMKPKPDYVAPDCAGTERITDAMLFWERLNKGERSAVFGSHSKILNHYAEADRTCFFYLHVGAEVARIEIPAWVADDAELLNQTHALCFDQAQKGDGYPVALAEAHEQAIIRGPERDTFFRLMGQGFVQRGLSLGGTQKALSKRARRV